MGKDSVKDNEPVLSLKDKILNYKQSRHNDFSPIIQDAIPPKRKSSKSVRKIVRLLKLRFCELDGVRIIYNGHFIKYLKGLSRDQMKTFYEGWNGGTNVLLNCMISYMYNKQIFIHNLPMSFEAFHQNLKLLNDDYFGKFPFELYLTEQVKNTLDQNILIVKSAFAEETYKEVLTFSDTYYIHQFVIQFSNLVTTNPDECRDRYITFRHYFRKYSASLTKLTVEGSLCCGIAGVKRDIRICPYTKFTLSEFNYLVTFIKDPQARRHFVTTMERDTFGQQLVSTYQATGMAEDGGHELGEKVTQSMNRTSEFINQIVDDKGKCMVTQVPEQIQPDSGDTFQYLTEYGKEMNEKAVRLYQTHKFIKDGRDVEVSAGGKIGVGEGEADVGGLSHSKKRTLDVNKDGKTGVGDEMVISDAGKTRYAGSYSAELRKSYQNSTSTSPFLVQESGASTTKKRRTDSYVAGTRNVVREEVVIPIKTVQKQASKQSSGLELKDKLKHSQDKGSPRSQSTSHALDKQPALQSPPTSLPNLQREARPKVGKHYSPALMRALAKNPPPSRGNGRSVSLVESTVRSILNASAPIISPVSVQVSNSVQVPNPAPVKVPSKNPAPVKVPSKNSFPGQHPLKASSPVRKSPIITSAPSAVPTSSTEEPVFKEPQIPSQFKETSNVPSSLDESKSNSKESDVPQSGTDKPNNFTHPVGYLSLLAGIRSSSKEDDITNALMQSSPNRSNINGFQNFYNTNAGDNSPIGVRKNHFNWYVNSGMDAIIPSELLLAQRLVPVTTESPSSNDQESITNSMKESVEPSESSSSNDQANRTDLEINVSSAVASKPFLNKEESFITGRGTNFFSGDWNNIWKGWKEDKQNCGDSVQGQSSLSFKGKSLSPDQGKSLYPVQEQSISPGQEQSISSGQEQSPTPGHQHSPVQERSEALKNLLASFQQRFLPFLSKEYSSPVQEHLPTPPLIQKQTSAPLHQQSCSPVQQFTPSPVLNYEPAAKKKCTPNSDLASKPFEQVSNNNLLIFPQFVNSLSQNAKTFLPSSMHVAPNANEPILRLSDERMIVPMINTNFNSQRTLKNSISTVPPNLRPNPSLSNPSLTERHLNELPIHPKPIDNVHSANLTPNVPVKKARKRPPRPAKASLQNKQNARKTENTECALSCSTFKSTNCTHLTHTDYAEPDLMRTLQEQITRGCIPSFLTADEEFAITEQTNPTPLLNQQSIGNNFGNFHQNSQKIPGLNNSLSYEMQIQQILNSPAKPEKASECESNNNSNSMEQSNLNSFNHHFSDTNSLNAQPTSLLNSNLNMNLFNSQQQSLNLINGQQPNLNIFNSQSQLNLNVINSHPQPNINLPNNHQSPDPWLKDACKSLANYSQSSSQTNLMTLQLEMYAAAILQYKNQQMVSQLSNQQISKPYIQQFMPQLLPSSATPQPNQFSVLRPGPFPTAQPHQSMVSQPLHCPTPQPHQLMVPQPLHCPTPQPHQLMVPQPLSCPTAQPQQLMTPQQFHYPTAQQLQLMFQQQLPFSTAQHQPIVSERSAFCPTAQHQQLTSSDLLSYLNQQQLMVQQNSAPTLPQQIFSPSDSMYDPQQQPKSDPPTPNPECHPPQQTSPETNVENCLNSNQNDCLVESERDAAIRATIASVIATAKEAPIKANINAAIKAAANEAAFNAANGEAGLRFASGIVQAFLSDPAQRETINGYGNIFDIPMNVLLELLKPYWNTFNS